MSTKLPIIKRFIDQLDKVLIGGALANIFFVAQGLSVGKSVFEEGVLEEAKWLLSTYGQKIILPEDVVCVRSLRKDAKKTFCSIDKINEKDRVVDIGPQAQKQFQQILEQAKTIVWNGPLGYCEISAFAEGTEQIAKVIAHQTPHATTIVGGGDTLPVIESLHLADKYTLLSTGGGALLQFLSGESLPGIDALKTSL